MQDKIYTNALLFAAVVLLLFSICVLVSISIADQEQYKNTLSILEKVSALIGGCSALVASVAAIFGLKTWRDQIIFAKHYGIIWDCIITLRQCRRRFFDWYVLEFSNWFSYDSENEKSRILLRDELLAHLDKLENEMGKLDCIVVRDEWKWSNKAMYLKLRILELNKQLSAPRKPVDGKEKHKDINRLNEILSDYFKSLENELVKLETS